MKKTPRFEITSARGGSGGEGTEGRERFVRRAWSEDGIEDAEEGEGDSALYFHALTRSFGS